MNSETLVQSSQLLTASEVRDLLKISKPHLDRLMASGRIKRVKMGRSVRFRPSDVEAFIESNTR
jgi:excisionase family DNA binding protein